MNTRTIVSGNTVSPFDGADSGVAGRFLTRTGWLREPVHDDPQSDISNERDRQLRFIGMARAVGYELHECRALIALATHPGDDGTRHERGVLRHVETVEQKIIALMKLRQVLLGLLADAPAAPVEQAYSGRSPQDRLLRVFDKSGEGNE